MLFDYHLLFYHFDGDDEDNAAPLYSDVVRFLTTFVSRLGRGDFRYNKTCSCVFLVVAPSFSL